MENVPCESMQLFVFRGFDVNACLLCANMESRMMGIRIGVSNGIVMVSVFVSQTPRIEYILERLNSSLQCGCTTSMRCIRIRLCTQMQWPRQWSRFLSRFNYRFLLCGANKGERNYTCRAVFLNYALMDNGLICVVYRRSRNSCCDSLVFFFFYCQHTFAHNIHLAAD